MMVKGGKAKEKGNHAKKMKRKNQQSTSSNMVLKGLLRPARYFDGLMTNPCYTPTKRPRKPCLICASVQHVTKHCSMNHREEKDCSDETSSSVCLRCGGLGHDMGLCKYEYTEDDLKNVQCYVCKSFGHLCCVEPCDSPPSASCYRCGLLGHTGLSCGRRHYEASPEIQSRVKETEKKNHVNSEGKYIPYESNGTMTEKKKHNKNLEQHSTTHESTRKRKKNMKAKGQQQPIEEKPSLRSGWITEDLEEDHFHRVKLRRLSSPTTPSVHDHHILPVSPPGHNHRLPTTHFGHNYGSPRFISGPPPSRLWQRNYLPTSPIEPLGHSHHRSPTSSYGGHSTGYAGNHRYSSFESNRHLLDLPFSRLRQSYYSPNSPIAPSGHNHRLLPVTPPGLNHRLPEFSSGEHQTGSLSTIAPHGGIHRDSSFEYDSPFSRWQPSYNPTSPITPPGHNHHMLPSTYLDRNHMLPSTYNAHNHRSPTFNSGGHYLSPLSSTRYGGNHRNSPFESDGHLSGPSASRWHPYYTPTTSSHHHHQQQQHIYGHPPSRYGPAHHYGKFSGSYERW